MRIGELVCFDDGPLRCVGSPQVVKKEVNAQ